MERDFCIFSALLVTLRYIHNVSICNEKENYYAKLLSAMAAADVILIMNRQFRIAVLILRSRYECRSSSIESATVSSARTLWIYYMSTSYFALSTRRLSNYYRPRSDYIYSLEFPATRSVIYTTCINVLQMSRISITPSVNSRET